MLFWEVWQAVGSPILSVFLGIAVLANTDVPTARLMDWKYKSTAKPVGFETDRVQGDDLNKFPIEHARTRYSEIIVLLRAASVIAYGWTVQKKVVCRLMSAENTTKNQTNLYTACLSPSDLSIPHWIYRH